MPIMLSVVMLDVVAPSEYSLRRSIGARSHNFFLGVNLLMLL
jgi:hypothetical protein